MKLVLFASFGVLLTLARADVIDLGGGQIFSPHFFHAPYDPSFHAPVATPASLPEIIVNRDLPQDPRSNRGYSYTRPTTLPPPRDEPSNDYLPPLRDPEPPNLDYLPPQPPRDEPVEPENGYLPPIENPFRSAKDLDFFRPSVNSLTGMKVEVRDLKCLQSPGGYFKAQLYIHENADTVPVIEQDPGDPRCEIKSLKSVSYLNVVSEDFSRCGVYPCGLDLCLKVRFPQIRGLKTGNDLTLTLQCKLPERVVAKTHSIRVGLQNGVTSRASGAVAHGGGQQLFHSQVGLFRKNEENLFSRPLHAGGFVQLGEEVMLRAQVRNGDGWNFTKLSDVVLQRYSPEGELLHSVALVTPGGCVNPLMRNICPLEPVLDAPLGYRFGFKAFMFQGMKSGDELVMNVKLSGCIYKKDCQLDPKCDPFRSLRVKRDADNETVAIPAETAHLSFRVEVPQADDPATSEPLLNPYQRFTLISVALVCAIGATISLIAHITKHSRLAELQHRRIFSRS